MKPIKEDYCYSRAPRPQINFYLMRENNGTVTLRLDNAKVFNGSDNDAKIAHSALVMGIEAAGHVAISKTPDFEWSFEVERPKL